MTADERRPKQTAFRIPQRTLDALDEIIEEGKARTRTDALIWAVDTARNQISSEGTNLEDRITKYEKKIEELAAQVADENMKNDRQAQEMLSIKETVEAVELYTKLVLGMSPEALERAKRKLIEDSSGRK